MQLLVLRRRSQLLILVLLLVHQTRLDHLLFLVLHLLLVLGQRVRINHPLGHLHHRLELVLHLGLVLHLEVAVHLHLLGLRS